MNLFVRTMKYLFFLLMVILNISCEKPTGDFVFNQAENWSDVIVVPITEDLDRSKLEDIKKAIMSDAHIVQVSALSDIPTKSASKVSVVLMEVVESEGTEAYISFIDYGFLKTLRLNLIEGRFFLKAFSNDSAAFIINEELLARIQKNQSGKEYFLPMGQKLRFDYKSQKYQGRIIGVIEDYRIHVDDGKSAGSVPMIFKLSAKAYRYLAVRTTDISAATILLQNKWNELAFSAPFEVFCLSDKVPDFAKIIIEKNKAIKLYVIDGILSLAMLILLGGLIINKQGTIGLLFQMRGRINRGKFFPLVLIINIIFNGVFYMITDTKSSASVHDSIDVFSGLLILISSLVFLIIGIFLIVKRFHDLERPGSNIWLLLIPFYNLYLGFVLYFERGTVGVNKYGEDPIPAS